MDIETFIANLDQNYSIEKHYGITKYHFYTAQTHFVLNVDKDEYNLWCDFMDIRADDIEFKSLANLKMFLNGIIQMFKSHNCKPTLI